MFCQKCGKSNPDHARFCENCGAPLQQVPPQVYQQPAPAYPQQPVYQQPVYQQPVYPQAQQFIPRGAIRSPGIAGVLSFVCCGLGQLYNGET
ncbi:MAG: zinc ribbon domain-containing protein, partial [Methanomicrobiales archaeon]|nr:zinc ribbon domain-containing protein [Methanomicrobiales archaeon]